MKNRFGNKNKHTFPNIEFHQAMAEKRRSSAASRHVLKKYKGSRKANNSAAINDSKKS